MFAMYCKATQARAKSRANFLVLSSYFMVEWLLCESVWVANG